MTIQLVFLARLRERFGASREVIPYSTKVATVADLLQTLRERGGNFAVDLAPDRAFRVAVNQDVVELNHPIAAGDEVAIFPPVTGG
jgi:sulfur-carrier protein